MAENERLYTIPQGKLRNLVDEDAQDAEEDRAEDRNQNGADGPGFQAGLDVHSTEVGHDMEILAVTTAFGFARISATETSLTLVPVGPVRIRPPHFWRAW